jgi:hypothetical protein
MLTAMPAARSSPPELLLLPSLVSRRTRSASRCGGRPRRIKDAICPPREKAPSPSSRVILLNYRAMLLTS